jgi:hypothetical protein
MQAESSRTQTVPVRALTTRQLGDAGEHWAMAKFMFAGCPAMKAPAGWPGFDIAVQNAGRLVPVSVRARSERTKTWLPWSFEHDAMFEWLVCVYVTNEGEVREWVIPRDEAFRTAKGRKNRRHVKDPNQGWLSLDELLGPLARFEGNWRMEAGDKEGQRLIAGFLPPGSPRFRLARPRRRSWSRGKLRSCDVAQP